MRSLNALKNMVMSLTVEVMLILFGLVMPRLIIETYGSEVNGLTSTINHILTILNLLQAGAVGASIFQMYKPVAEKDYYKMSMVLDASRRYFRKIGMFFLVLVVLVAPIMSLSTGDETSTLSFWEKSLSFLILGLNGASYLFIASGYDILFSSHQKRYLLSLALIIDKLVYYGLLLAIIFLKLHFILMYVAVLVGTSARLIFLYFIYRKQYKPLLVKVKSDSGFKIENRGYLLCNQIATQSVDGLPTVLVTAVSGLTSASVYAVYNLVQNMIKMVVRTVQLSVSEIFGNLVVSADEKRVRRVYNILEFVFFLAAVVLCCCAAFLIMPFIYLYTDGNSFDVNYLYPALAVAVVAYGVLYSMYMPVYTLTNVYGFFKETYLQAVITAAVSTGVALLLGIFVEWTFILFGPVLYYAITLIYRMIVARGRVSWLRLGSFFRRMTVMVITVAASTVLSTVIYGSGGYAIGGWWTWIGHAVLCGLSVLAVVGVYVLLFERDAARGLFGYAKRLVAKKFGKKKASKNSEG